MSYCFMGIELQLGTVKSVLEMDGGGGGTKSMYLMPLNP